MHPHVEFQAKYDAWLYSPSSSIITAHGHGARKEFSHALFRRLKKSSLFASYFSFSDTDMRRTSAAALLGSTIFQLLDQDSARFSRTESLYIAMKKSEAWTQAGLFVLFQSLLDTRGLDPLYLIIDSLHKCDLSWKELLDVLFAVLNKERSPAKLKVAVFYQERPDIQGALEKFAEFRGNEPILMKGSLRFSVDALTTRVIGEYPYLLPLKSRIAEILEACRDSTELLLAVYSLGSSNGSPHSLKSILALTKTLPQTTADVVSTQFRALKEWARLALGWIAHAKRPLKLNELVIAVALTDIDADFAASFDPLNLPLDIVAEIRSAFGPLLRVECGDIFFSTDDIKDCFLRLIAEERQRSGNDAEVKGSGNSLGTIIPDDAQITRTLFEYLSRAEFLGSIEDALRKEQYIQPRGVFFDLAAYAVQFWPMHYRAAEKLGSPTNKVLELFQNNRMVRVWYELNSRVNSAASPSDLCVTDPSLLAAQLGMAGIVEAMEDDLEGANRDVAISLASWGGHADIVELLLRDANKAGSSNLSKSLRYSSAHGYDQIVGRLLEHMRLSKNLSSSQLDELTCQAAQLGYERQISLFLHYGANVDAAIENMTPLQHSAQNGHASVAYFLLKVGGADVDSKSGEGSDAPIILATRGGYQTVVEHLLEFNADINRTGGLTCSSPLQLAAQNGHEEIVRQLLDYLVAAKANRMITRTETSPLRSDIQDMTKSSFINSQDLNGRSPLMAACAKGHKVIAKWLLEKGADVTLLDSDNHTALYHAICPGNESLAETISSHVDSVDTFKDIGEIFLRAAKYGFINIIHQGLDSQTQINSAPLSEYSDSNGRTALHYAAENGHTGIISLFSAVKDVDNQDYEGRTPLALAAVAGKAEIVKSLLCKGADALRRNFGDETILLQVVKNPACSASHINVVNTLLENGVDPSSTGIRGRTALHWAAGGGVLEIVESLLRHGADTDSKDKDLWNPLHFAAQDGSRDAARIAKLLIEAGIDPLEGDEDDWIPMHTASQYGSVGMLEFLWENAPDSINARANDGRTVIHFGYNQPKSLEWLLQRGVTLDSTNNKGETALMLAAIEGKAESIRVLLENHADPTVCDDKMRTALHHAAIHGRSGIGQKLLKRDKSILCYKDEDNCSALHLAVHHYHQQFAEMLLDEYYTEADLENLNAVSTYEGVTPLISAVDGNMGSLVDKLLKRGVDTEVRMKNGYTALLIAVAGVGIEMVRLLLNFDIANHANVDAGGGVHPTALHEAADDGNIELVEELIMRGAKVNAQGGAYNTALTAAAFGGFDETVDLLLENGADARIAGGKFSNALSAALYTMPYYPVDKLIAAGADINAKDSHGRTSLHIAAYQSDWEMIEELRAAGGELTIKDKQGRTLLHHAAAGSCASIISECLKDEKLRDLYVEDADGWMPLHWACRSYESTDVVETFVEHDIDIFKATKDGWTPKNIAIFHQADTVALIIEKAAGRNEPIASDEVDESNRAASSESKSRQMAESRHWKVGGCHEFESCEGCFQDVSQKY